jgi:hypothetical protein
MLHTDHVGTFTIETCGRQMLTVNSSLHVAVNTKAAASVAFPLQLNPLHPLKLDLNTLSLHKFNPC